MFVADDTDLGALAVHFPGGYSRVHVDRSSGFDHGDDSILNGAGHEICEAINNLQCDRWVPMPGRPGQEVAREVSDPVQDSYQRIIGGRTVDLANFVLPSWFQPGSSGPFDFAGRLTAPGQVGPEGYLVLRGAKGVFLEGRVKIAKLLNVNSRTVRCMQRAA